MAQRRKRSTALARTRRRATGSAPAPAAVHGILPTTYFPRVPREEAQRPHLGRSVNLSVIDLAIRSANRGLMRRLTDLSLETIKLDGHASALWQKRLNRLAALPWVVEPASGDGINEQRAEDYAGFVRDQLKAIPNFRQVLMDINGGHYHGRACSEIEWDLHRGTWRARDLHWVHPRRLSFGPDRDVRVIDLRSEIGNFEDIGFPVQRVPYKFVTFVPRVFGDYPEREGLAPRHVFWSFFARLGVRERLHLMEVWGKPWRIAFPKPDVDNPTGINQEQIDDAYDALNSLGGQSTAVLPIAMQVMIPQPSKGAGDVHDAAVDHAEKTISKLFAGGTATTDAVSTGLGSSIGNIHASEEDLIIAMDAFRESEALEDQLTDAIIVVNFGPEAVTHAPTFRIATDAPLDRAGEADLIAKALDVGIRIAEKEIRERLGFRELRGDEAFVQRMPRLIDGVAPLHLPLPEVIYPAGDKPDRGVLPDVPQIEGAPPRPVLPPGQSPPRPGAPAPTPAPPPAPTPARELPPGGTEEEPLTDRAAEFLAAKMTQYGITECEHRKKNRCWLCGIERDRDFDLGEDGQPVRGDDGELKWSVKWKPIGATRVPAGDGEDSEGERKTQTSS
jgi:phage gp29-like protein